MQSQIQSKHLFVNSIASDYTRKSYMIYLQKYLEICGYHDLADHKAIENEFIEVIIMFKEKGMKQAAISNYTKPVVSYCRINDIVLNTKKINMFMPTQVRSKKTRV